MLYEMAAARHAFKRSSAVETLAAIIREDPEPLPASVPAPLRWIILRCLAKEPRDRYESSRDLFLELRSLREHLSDTSSTCLLYTSPLPLNAQSADALVQIRAFHPQRPSGAGDVPIRILQTRTMPSRRVPQWLAGFPRLSLIHI